ncbi:VOC family protein [uncultured Devosia sp.]|uniref:VOC family protein n=1 Tax=uncultured Devosia sp. TaxID=211434 RepID=UPI0035C9BAF8
MFDHLGFAVGDFDRSAAFYDAALAPLGIKRVTAFEYPGGQGIGYGSGEPQFWINSGAALRDGVHIAFAARSRAQVIAFHEAALAAGGRDNGGPGIREQYHPNYYAAFVLYPDGHNIEAVCHAPQ